MAMEPQMIKKVSITIDKLQIISPAPCRSRAYCYIMAFAIYYHLLLHLSPPFALYSPSLLGRVGMGLLFGGETGRRHFLVVPNALVVEDLSIRIHCSIIINFTISRAAATIYISSYTTTSHQLLHVKCLNFYFRYLIYYFLHSSVLRFYLIVTFFPSMI